MLNCLKKSRIINKLRKSPAYSRIRQYFPMPELEYSDDRDRINDAEIIRIDWPVHIKKPVFGIVKDYDKCPRWTKYCRFLENNSFPYDFYNIHAHDWMESGKKFDIIIGFVSSELWHLDELHKKYYALETFLGKTCYPSFGHIFLYEDKSLEAYISKVADIPFANTYISHDKKDALRLIEKLRYPVVAKIVPSSGSLGVELLRSPRQSRKVVEQVFSRNGRKTHLTYFHQKNYIYFQDYIPNDGYDIRAMVVGNWVFGYYRKVLKGDFRASGMNLVEKRGLPEEAMRVALKLNKTVKSPLLVVDMLHSLDDQYHVIEYSPVCLMETPEQLHVDGIPGVYIFNDDGSFHFEEGRYWLHELALREFLLRDYLPKIQ